MTISEQIKVLCVRSNISVAELARRAGDYEASSRWISKVLTSRNASERIKDKARNVKELIEKDREKETN